MLWANIARVARKKTTWETTFDVDKVSLRLILDENHCCWSIGYVCWPHRYSSSNESSPSFDLFDIFRFDFLSVSYWWINSLIRSFLLVANRGTNLIRLVASVTYHHYKNKDESLSRSIYIRSVYSNRRKGLYDSHMSCECR